MSTTPPPVHYEIKVEGILDGHWSAWFEGLRVTSDEHGQTTIAGRSSTRPRSTACSPGSATSACR